MFALNADANTNACEPSQKLSKSPRRMSPCPDGSGRCIVHTASNGPSACGAMCLHSTIELRRSCGGWGWRKTGGSTAARGKARSTNECQPGEFVCRGYAQAMAKGAYAGHRSHRSSVPGSDVRIEQNRPIKCLQAKPSALEEHALHEPEGSLSECRAWVYKARKQHSSSPNASHECDGNEGIQRPSSSSKQCSRPRCSR
jgi:hypothetical protein